MGALRRKSEREPGELKHLSTPRKRDYSLSSGERTGNSPNPRGRERHTGQCPAGVVRHRRATPCYGREVTKPCSSRRTLERAAKESDSLVGERARAFLACVLEYHGTRGIPWEAGGA